MSSLVERLINDESLRKHSYTYEEKLEVLKYYVEQSTTKSLANIMLKDKFVIGHTTIPIGDWIEWLRNKYKAGNLTENQVKELEDLGIKWQGDNRNYEGFSLQEKVLRDYASHSPTNDISGIKRFEKYVYMGKVYCVGGWISTYRNKNYNDEEIADYERKVLDELGMLWDADNKTYMTFKQKLEILTAYANDPDKGKGTIAFIHNKEVYVYKGEVYCVGAMIKAFRKSYSGKSGYKKLEPWQVKTLENIGMVWEVDRRKKQSDKPYIENNTNKV